MVQSVLHEIGGKGEHGHLHRKGARTSYGEGPKQQDPEIGQMLGICSVLKSCRGLLTILDGN